MGGGGVGGGGGGVRSGRYNLCMTKVAEKP